MGIFSEKSPYATYDYVNTVSGSITSQVDEVTSLSTVQVERTTTYSVSDSWDDIEFNSTSYENDSDTIEHDTSNLERILIKADGTYSLTYGLAVQAQNTTTYTYGRIYKNGNTVVPASNAQIRSYQGEIHELSGSVTRDLQAGDYVVVQLYRDSQPVDVVSGHFNVIKLDGVRGQQGSQGPPGTLTISGSAYFDAYDASGGQSVTGSWSDVSFDTIRKNSGDFETAGATELTIPQTATYNVTVRVTTHITSGTSRSDCKIRLMKDTGSGYTEIPGSLAYTYNRTDNLGTDTANVTILDDLDAGDKIKLQVAQDSGSSTIQLLANGSSLTVFIPGGPPGQDGQDGADGLPGSGSTINVQDEGSLVTGGPHSTINFTGQMVSAYDMGSGVAEVWVQPPTFGTWYGWNGDESETSTTSTSPVQKARLTLTGIPEGYYRIGWYYEWRRDAAWNDYQARIQIDDSTTIMEHIQEPQDTNSWHPVSGFYITNLSSGNHYVDFDHYGDNSGYTSYTRRLRLEIWRVA